MEPPEPQGSKKAVWAPGCGLLEAEGPTGNGCAWSRVHRVAWRQLEEAEFRPGILLRTLPPQAQAWCALGIYQPCVPQSLPVRPLLVFSPSCPHSTSSGPRRSGSFSVAFHSSQLPTGQGSPNIPAHTSTWSVNECIKGKILMKPNFENCQRPDFW